MAYVKFEKNVPQQVALKSLAFEKVQGDYGPQARFMLLDGRALYLNMPTAQHICESGIKAGEPFRITKKQRPDGRNFEWRVERQEMQPAAAFLHNGESLEQYSEELAASTPQTQLEAALKTAVAAAASAEKDEVLTTTRSKAQVLSGHSPVIWLTGITGCYHLDHVRPIGRAK